MSRLLVVGGGLAGSIPAKLAQSMGWEVIVFDDGNPWAASRAAENLFAESWIKTVGKSEVTTALDVLGSLYVVRQMSFSNGKGKSSKVYHVPIPEILWPNPIRERVTSVFNGEVITERGNIYRGTVLVAAGVWTNHLLKAMPKVQGLTGHGLVFEGELKGQPLMNMWAPYRHQKIMPFGANQTWYGDSTAVEDERYVYETRVADSIKRAEACGLSKANLLRVLVGRRPYIKGEKGFYRQVSNRLFVSTAGKTTGMILYAYHAHLLMKDLTR